MGREKAFLHFICNDSGLSFYLLVNKKYVHDDVHDDSDKQIDLLNVQSCVKLSLI